MHKTSSTLLSRYSSLLSAEDQADFPPELLVLVTPGGPVVVDQERFHIGSGPACEMRFETGPSLHSTIHRQGDVTWIEAEEGSTLVVNGTVRRRMALRAADVLEIEGHRIEINFETDDVLDDLPGPPVGESRLEEDLSLLSAEELCERIMAEQAMIDEFEAGRRAGLEGLLDAVNQTHEAESHAVSLPLDVSRTVEAVPSTLLVDSNSDCQRLLGQIRDLSAMVGCRSEELDQCESELIAATSQLAEAQDHVTQQIGDLLDQLQTLRNEPELRASA